MIALLSAVVMGIAQINTEQVQLMRNQIYAAQALAIAEAGLNDAFAEIRVDSGGWTGPITAEVFDGGEYSVTVAGTLPNLTVVSTGTSSQGFIARVEADVTVGTSTPYVIRIDNLRINE